jgi:propionyl-CoA synthetase
MPSTQSRYHEAYARWSSDPEGFWAEAAREIDWIKPADRIFDPEAGAYGAWFTGALCNTCHNAVDRHVATRGDQAAIIYDSPVTGSKRTITYAQMQDEVATLAAVLQDMGVRKGDRVVVYMPMIPEAAIGMLACARIGAVHSVVFGGFAAKELATASTTPSPRSSSRPPAASRAPASSPTSPCSTRRSSSPPSSRMRA